MRGAEQESIADAVMRRVDGLDPILSAHVEQVGVGGEVDVLASRGDDNRLAHVRIAGMARDDPEGWKSVGEPVQVGGIGVVDVAASGRSRRLWNHGHVERKASFVDGIELGIVDVAAGRVSRFYEHGTQSQRVAPLQLSKAVMKHIPDVDARNADKPAGMVALYGRHDVVRCRPVRHAYAPELYGRVVAGDRDGRRDAGFRDLAEEIVDVTRAADAPLCRKFGEEFARLGRRDTASSVDDHRSNSGNSVSDTNTPVVRA